jgi:hypothetical protein
MPLRRGVGAAGSSGAEGFNFGPRFGKEEVTGKEEVKEEVERRGKKR